MTELHDDYVAGDINTIDEHESAVNVDDATTATAVLTFVAKSLAEDPNDVAVSLGEKSGKVLLSLQVGPNDMGRIIGRRGRTAQAIRALVAAAGSRDGVQTSVDIVD